MSKVANCSAEHGVLSLEEKTLPGSTGDPCARVLWHQFPPVTRGLQLSVQQLRPWPVTTARSHRGGRHWPRRRHRGQCLESQGNLAQLGVGFRTRLHGVRGFPVVRSGWIGHFAGMPKIWMSQAIKMNLGDHAPCDPVFLPKAIARAAPAVPPTASLAKRAETSCASPTADGSLQGPAADSVRCSVCGTGPVGARWNWSVTASRRQKISRGVPVRGRCAKPAAGSASKSRRRAMVSPSNVPFGKTNNDVKRPCRAP